MGFFIYGVSTGVDLGPNGGGWRTAVLDALLVHDVQGDVRNLGAPVRAL